MVSIGNFVAQRNRGIYRLLETDQLIQINIRFFILMLFIISDSSY